jgi:hypothetical protein
LGHIFFAVLLSVTLLHFSCIRPSDLHPSPAPHFKTLKVFLIYFPKCSYFSII